MSVMGLWVNVLMGSICVLGLRFLYKDKWALGGG